MGRDRRRALPGCAARAAPNELPRSLRPRAQNGNHRLAEPAWGRRETVQRGSRPFSGSRPSRGARGAPVHHDLSASRQSERHPGDRRTESTNSVGFWVLTPVLSYWYTVPSTSGSQRRGARLDEGTRGTRELPIRASVGRIGPVVPGAEGTGRHRSTVEGFARFGGVAPSPRDAGGPEATRVSTDIPRGAGGAIRKGMRSEMFGAFVDSFIAPVSRSTEGDLS